MTMSIDIHSQSFPPVLPNGRSSLTFTKTVLLWASITVGRPGKSAVTKHADYWHYEAAYRWNMVLACLDLAQATQSIRHTALFDDLDPTEKVTVSYHLGMIFTRLAAQKLLHTPWMMHLGWMSSLPTFQTGNSRPDLCGLSTATGDWSVFEAKSRNGPHNRLLLQKAKGQARQIATIDGKAPAMTVGCLLSRVGQKGSLQFHWQDPAADDEGDRIESTRETWLQYYTPLLALHLDCEKRPGHYVATFGHTIALNNHAFAFAKALQANGDAWVSALRALQAWSKKDRVDDLTTFGDGLKLIPKN